MRLLIHDTLATAPFVAPLRAGWVEPAAGLTVETRATLRGDDLTDQDVALLPSPEAAVCQDRCLVVPDVAVVANGSGPISLRTPVRPDEIARSAVRLLEASSAAAALARATLRPYYGIEATTWIADESDPTAQVVIVEGVEALRPAEGGFAEDLCRAWFILTGLPVVTHVLLAPLAADRETLRPALATLAALRQAGAERRREWRGALAEQSGLERDRLTAAFAGQRLALEADDRRALLALLQRGGRGAAHPPPPAPRFLEYEATTIDGGAPT